uniref:Uncharacterized protein n=1 Tax=Glossina austeni TaxID=7395 RepID=A0A1A9V0X8_GLOAU
MDHAMNGCALTGHCFNHHSDCHTRWEAVRIKHKIGYKSGFGKWQIFSGIFLRTNALLTGTRGKFITDSRPPSTNKVEHHTQVCCPDELPPTHDNLLLNDLKDRKVCRPEYEQDIQNPMHPVTIDVLQLFSLW